MSLVARPIWRLFDATQLARAARHARSGGLAVVRMRTWMLLGPGGDGRARTSLVSAAAREPPEMVDWAIHAVHASWWLRETNGPLAGLVRAPVTKRYRSFVETWAERDARYRGAIHRVRLDCTACAACCRDNQVVLRDADLERWRKARRHDLIERTQVWRFGRRRLPLVEGTKACIHLAGKRCGIYALRPEMCSEFVPGSEHCLSAREQQLGFALPSTNAGAPRRG